MCFQAWMIPGTPPVVLLCPFIFALTAAQPAMPCSKQVMVVQKRPPRLLPAPWEGCSKHGFLNCWGRNNWMLNNWMLPNLTGKELGCSGTCLFSCPARPGCVPTGHHSVAEVTLSLAEGGKFLLLLVIAFLRVWDCAVHTRVYV